MQAASQRFPWKLFVVLSLPLLLLALWTQNNGLFNDTMQFAGDVPLWYYLHDFSSLLPPDFADSGHPPGFGLYLAALFKLFGCNLYVAHWAMFPFSLMIVYQAIRLAMHLFKDNKEAVMWLSVLIVYQTPVLSQLTLVSPDILVFALALWMVNSIWSRNTVALGVAVLLVGLVSIRGMSIAVCLYLMKCWYDWVLSGKTRKISTVLLTAIVPFLLGGCVALAYFIFHYSQKGWITPNEATPWGGAFISVNMIGWLKNMAVLVWRFLDLGGIGGMTLCFVMLLHYQRKNDFYIPEEEVLRIKFLAYLIVPLVLATALPLTFYLGLLTHRYLIFLATILLCVGEALLWYNTSYSLKQKRAILSIILLVQLTGSFWPYPQELSKSWDCTLAHLPYYELRQEFLAFMESEDIDKSKVVTEFPMQKSAAVINYELSDTLSFPLWNEVNQKEVAYLWYSNVCNALLKQKQFFDQNYTVLKQKKVGQVEMILYQKKN